MSDQPARGSRLPLSPDTQISVVFVLLGVTSWLAARSVTDSQPVQFALLVGLGVVAPTRINEWRG